MVKTEVKPRLDRPRALFVLGEANLDLIYSGEVREEIGRLVDVFGPPQTRESIELVPELLAETEIMISGWGAPTIDAAFLAKAPKLKAVFYGSGSVRAMVSDAFWDRGLVISSAWGANAVPVAEYSLGVILLSLKHFWRYSTHAKAGGEWGDQHRFLPGGYQTTVGVVSCGMVARRLLELLKPFETRRVVYCPFLSAAEALQLNVERCSLPELFRRSDVVTVHTPHLPETTGFITGQHIASMKYGATLINTARGGVIREDEMIEVLAGRPDLTAVLDVAASEPPPAGSELLSLPNVVLTPHISGSHHHECRRMGAVMLEELRRYLAGEPLVWQVTREMVARMA
jgi:phosphoglycerate dehydrogenase-like enzyme